MLKREQLSETDGLQVRRLYPVYPPDYPFPEAIEAVKVLSSAKRDEDTQSDSFPWITSRSTTGPMTSDEGPDSFPWIETRAPDQSEESDDTGDSFPWIREREVEMQGESRDQTDSFPWIQSRKNYATYPEDYSSPQAIDAAKKLAVPDTTGGTPEAGLDDFVRIKRTQGTRDEHRETQASN